jgi:hypothetical protein
VRPHARVETNCSVHLPCAEIIHTPITRALWLQAGTAASVLSSKTGLASPATSSLRPLALQPAPTTSGPPSGHPRRPALHAIRYILPSASSAPLPSAQLALSRQDSFLQETVSHVSVVTVPFLTVSNATRQDLGATVVLQATPFSLISLARLLPVVLPTASPAQDPSAPTAIQDIDSSPTVLTVPPFVKISTALLALALEYAVLASLATNLISTASVKSTAQPSVWLTV